MVYCLCESPSTGGLTVHAGCFKWDGMTWMSRLHVTETQGGKRTTQYLQPFWISSCPTPAWSPRLLYLLVTMFPAEPPALIITAPNSVFPGHPYPAFSLPPLPMGVCVCTAFVPLCFHSQWWDHGFVITLIVSGNLGLQS